MYLIFYKYIKNPNDLNDVDGDKDD